MTRIGSNRSRVRRGVLCRVSVDVERYWTNGAGRRIPYDRPVPAVTVKPAFYVEGGRVPSVRRLRLGVWVPHVPD